MRILSIHLKNYRGIAERKVAFARDGVTLIEGPNEAGKSSLAEALDLVLFAHDSTGAKRYTAIHPVGSDDGTEVEVEMEAGGYRFVYGKRFFRKKRTWLTMKAPREEQLTGRDAHERVEAILRETIDLDLWRALRITQGSGVEQPQGLKNAPSLVRALGTVGGGNSNDESGLPLFEAVEAEYARYFTKDRGQAKKELQHAYERVEEAAAEVSACSDELDQLEQDVDRVTELESQLKHLKAERSRAAQNAAKREQELAELDGDRNALGRLDLACKRASMEESSARREQGQRAEMVSQLERAARERARAESEAARNEPEYGDIEQRLGKERSRKADAEARIKDADELVQLRERDANFRRGEIDLAQLTMRRDRVQEAEAEAEAARELLDAVKLDDAAIKEIRGLSLLLAGAQAQLDAGSPRLRVKALGEGVSLDGEAVAVDETVERNVAERASLTVDGVVEVVVTAGTSVDDLVAARDEARDRLQALLAKAGAQDLEEAEVLLRNRTEAERVLERSGPVISEYLGDLDYARLCGKVENTRRYVERYPAERPAHPTMAPDFDAAVEAKRGAKRVLEIARIEEQEAAAGFSATNEAWQEAKRRTFQTKERVRHAVETERQAAAALQAARAQLIDEDLEQSLRIAQQRRDASERAYAEARQKFDAREPDRLKQLADNAKRTEASTAARLDAARQEHTRLAGGLEVRGERGLYDQREAARTNQRQAEMERGALERRAKAAKLLFETMRDAREEAQRSYVGPLRERILELGRVVFGHGFSVELDEELNIVTRTLDSKTLPLESLSMGAQEQLSLLSRVACALTVDPADGAPLIFDDTLGNSDPDRLEAMGAMLAQAGEQCQMIVLTCTPDRFRHIGGATVISL